jgi:hypothetical protein
MAISYFDSVIESTSAIADAVFSKRFVVRWNGQRCPITAILSAHPILTDPGDNAESTSTHSHNFEINAAGLMFGGQVVEPQAGMEIEEEMADGSVNLYEVRPRDKARAFDPLDAEATRLLVYAVYFLNETV